MYLNLRTKKTTEQARGQAWKVPDFLHTEKGDWDAETLFAAYDAVGEAVRLTDTQEHPGSVAAIQPQRPADAIASERTQRILNITL